MEIFSKPKKVFWFSKRCWLSRIENFDQIPWEFYLHSWVFSQDTWFWSNLRTLSPRKIDKTREKPFIPIASNDPALCRKKFSTKILKKPRIHEFSRIFEKLNFFFVYSMCYFMLISQKWNEDTENNLKKPQNLAYLWLQTVTYSRIEREKYDLSSCE